LVWVVITSIASKIRNPNIEIRNKSQIQITKSQNTSYSSVLHFGF
jgi:hypothetical protein